MEVQLPGLFPPGFTATERVNLSEMLRKYGHMERPPRPTVTIADARPLQAQAASEADFLDKHGFLLLDAPAAATDWSDADDVAQHYFPIIEAIIRDRLYPGRKMIVFQPPRIVRRGAGTDTPQYGSGVHQDHDRTADDYEFNVAAFAGKEMAARWRARLEQDDVDSFVVLDFWRTTNMAEPLRHMPLALCDPLSVDESDILSTALEGVAPGGGLTRHISLKHNPGQRWYYYPEMTRDEMLVFKLFELRRGEEPQRYRACYHCAVEDPTAPADAQPRQSCEHRVSVMLLK